MNPNASLETQILKALKKGLRTSHDISDIVHGGSGTVSKPIMKELERMEKKGLVKKQGRDGYLKVETPNCT